MWKQGSYQWPPQHQPLPKALSTVLSVKSPGPPNGGKKITWNESKITKKFHLNVQHRTKRVRYAGFILGTVEAKPWKKWFCTQETQTLLEDSSSWCGIASPFTNSTIINSPLYSQPRFTFSKPALIGFLLLTWLILEPPGRHTFPRDPYSWIMKGIHSKCELGFQTNKNEKRSRKAGWAAFTLATWLRMQCSQPLHSLPHCGALSSLRLWVTIKPPLLLSATLFQQQESNEDAQVQWWLNPDLGLLL